MSTLAVTLCLAVPAAQAEDHAAERPERLTELVVADVSARAQVGRSCSAHKAVRYYSRRIDYWRSKMGAPGVSPRGAATGCPRYLARVLRQKAHAAQKAYRRWWTYHYAWWEWLPDKWARIGACETGYGKRPGQWTWNSGTYQGAFGFYHGTWDQYKPKGAPSEAYLATPRQQYQCALNVYYAHGYGAWGCGGA